MPLRYRRSSNTWEWPLQNQDGIVICHNDAKTFQADLEIPSFKASEIEVKVINEELVIRCAKETEGVGGTVRTREIQRSYKLPPDVDLRTVKSTIRNDGKLHIVASKKPR